jgi:WD40 repeat protein/serine/threonine protein kinase
VKQAEPDGQAAADPEDPRVLEALHTYLAALEAGGRPDRQQFLAQHPDLAGALGDYLDALEFVHQVAPQLQPPDEPAAPAPALPLGEYRIVRELGRGGMGVVYEADQLSLGRRVALKVLPFAAGLDARQLQRFKNEAQAAACLHHQNIVPVHAVGHERGVHYYAMQLIEGRTLAALVAELRLQAGLRPRDGDPTEAGLASATDPAPVAAPGSSGHEVAAFFRIVASLGTQAARALEHAHSLGVVHRDIKPGNLMVDARGHLWVTDFGLAFFHQADTRLTLTGDLVGTLRYMSPEQALGRRGIDHRTDVYSLGATLYELLTLEPAFTGRDRQDLLRQIAFEEPRPLRRVNRHVPAELETVVLKALAKEPAERYASAADLADDLQRFLDDMPIQARRPTLYLRAVKWSRRHRAVVLSAAVSLVTLLAALVLVLWLNNQRMASEKRAADERRELTEQSLHRETRDRKELERALAGERLQKRRAQMFLGQQREALYAYGLSLAHHEWLGNRVARAEALLDECPWTLRQWEWRYLKRLCHAGLLSLPGHPGNVSGIAFAPDGKSLAAACVDGGVRLWDAAGGRLLRTLRGHTSVVDRVTFSPDGTLLASGDGGGLVLVHDVRSGRASRLPGHAGWVSGLAFSADGKSLWSSSSAREVRLWDWAAGRELRRLPPLPFDIHILALAPDGRTLAAATSGGVLVLDPQTGQELRRLRGHRNKVLAVAFHPGSRLLASTGVDEDIRVWDAPTGRLVARFPSRAGTGFGVAFDAAGLRLASCHDSQVVKVWDWRAGTEILTLRGHTSPVHCVAFSPDGSRLASGEFDHTVKVWDARQGQEYRLLQPGGKSIDWMAVSADGRRLAWSPRGGGVRLREAGAGGAARVLAPGLGFLRLAFDAEGKTLAGACLDRTVRVWDVASGRERCCCRGHTALVAVLAFSADGGRLASGGLDRTVRVWDASTGAERLVLSGHLKKLGGLAFSPDGRVLASAGYDGRVCLWDTAGGELRRVLRGHTGFVLGVAFSPDGRRVASASNDSMVRLWDAETGRGLRVLGRNGGIWSGVAFSPDGRRLAASTANGTVELWDADSGRGVLSLPGKGYGAVQVTFTPDGNGLLASSTESGIRLWDGMPLPAPRRPLGFPQLLVESLGALLESPWHDPLSHPNLRAINRFLRKQLGSLLP